MTIKILIVLLLVLHLGWSVYSAQNPNPDQPDTVALVVSQTTANELLRASIIGLGIVSVGDCQQWQESNRKAREQHGYVEPRQR